MGRKLLETEPVFADVVRECDRLARPFIDWSILDELTAAEDRSHVNATYALQPTMFALQMGLVALWRSWGVEPEGVVGHSLGDITAACVAGIIDLPTALQIICNRSRIQDKANPEGGMLYATLPAAEAEEICVQHPDALWLSAINGPRAVTCSRRSRKISRPGACSRGSSASTAPATAPTWILCTTSSSGASPTPGPARAPCPFTRPCRGRGCRARTSHRRTGGAISASP
jgi:acyl transferase domain-containing protein